MLIRTWPWIFKVVRFQKLLLSDVGSNLGSLDGFVVNSVSLVCVSARARDFRQLLNGLLTGSVFDSNVLLARNKIWVIISRACCSSTFLRVDEWTQTEPILRFFDDLGRDVVVLWTWVLYGPSLWMFLVAIDGPLLGGVLFCGVEVIWLELAWAWNFCQHLGVHEFSFCTQYESGKSTYF